MAYLGSEFCKGRNLRISDLGGRRSTGGWVFRSLNGRFRVSEAQAARLQRIHTFRPILLKKSLRLSALSEMQNSVPNSRAKRRVFGCFATPSEYFPTKIAYQVSWQSFSTQSAQQGILRSDDRIDEV